MTALDRHVALVGFMGAGKSTLGPQLAERLGRRFVSVDDVVERRSGRTVADLFERDGEARFRELEEKAAADVLDRRQPAVVELGGGALGSSRTRGALDTSVFTLLVETSLDDAWSRVVGSDRPLARDEAVFRTLFDERKPAYERVADAQITDLDGAVLACAGVALGARTLDRLGELIPGDGQVALVADRTVAGLYGARARDALGDRLAATYEVPAGEAAKTHAEAERLWSALRLDRTGTLVALGGGSAIDLTGFVAATYLRGIAWTPVATTLVAQVDAAIGGKTAIDVAGGKNLVGAFWWPDRVVCDPQTLETLPDEELDSGRAEVVKTGLLMGEEVWTLEPAQQVRRCAAFKSGICLRDPRDSGERAQLNLGHTFAHALEAAADFRLPHGRAVALGLLAALRLSGLEEQAALVTDVLAPEPVSVDREAAWAALARDKKSVEGSARLVLLDAPGQPRWNVELPVEDVRRALDELIA
ncbi:MAG: bifunctional shikimate kinase/3-dehydroquinate synthase [Actinobacteria bacterium]|nr:bifunctional shikimate kinase/3-dehydroquinate synthase [Actinomycetota bacterium]